MKNIHWGRIVCGALAVALAWHGLRPAVAADGETAPVAVAPAAAASAALEAFVPAGCEVTIRANVRKALDSVELEPLRTRFMGGAVQQGIDMIAQWVGVDLRTDIDTALLAGFMDKAREKDGLVLLQGRFDKKRILDGLKLGGQFQEAPSGSETIYGYWDNKDQEMKYLFFAAEDVLILGRQESVDAAVAAQAKPGARLIDNAAYAEALKRIEGAPMLALAAVAPEELPPGEEDNFILRLARSAYAVADVDKDLRVTVSLTLSDPETAQRFKEMGQGLLALAQVQDRFPGLVEVAKRVELKTDGASNVTASARLGLDEAQQLFATFPRHGAGLGQRIRNF